MHLSHLSLEWQKMKKFRNGILKNDICKYQVTFNLKQTECYGQN